MACFLWSKDPLVGADDGRNSGWAGAVAYNQAVVVSASYDRFSNKSLRHKQFHQEFLERGLILRRGAPHLTRRGKAHVALPTEELTLGSWLRLRRVKSRGSRPLCGVKSETRSSSSPTSALRESLSPGANQRDGGGGLLAPLASRPGDDWAAVALGCGTGRTWAACPVLLAV